MRTNRVLILFTAALLITNGLHAIKPVVIDAEKDSKLMIEKIDKDVVLTQSQKVALESKAKEYLIKNAKAKNAGANDPKLKDLKIVFDKKGSSDYERALDSILTDSQKAQRLLKQKARMDEVSLRNKSKK